MVQALETENELQQCKHSEARYVAMEEATAEKLWSVGQSYFSNEEDSIYDEALSSDRSIVQQYAENVIDFDSSGYDGRNCSLMGTSDGVSYSWSLIGSMLFAITVYTTVGPCRTCSLNPLFVHSFIQSSQTTPTVTEYRRSITLLSPATKLGALSNAAIRPSKPNSQLYHIIINSLHYLFIMLSPDSQPYNNLWKINQLFLRP